MHPFRTHFLLWRGSILIYATWTQEKQQVKREFFQDFENSLKLHDYNTYTYPKIILNWKWRKVRKKIKRLVNSQFFFLIYFLFLHSLTLLLFLLKAICLSFVMYILNCQNFCKSFFQSEDLANTFQKVTLHNRTQSLFTLTSQGPTSALDKYKNFWNIITLPQLWYCWDYVP